MADPDYIAGREEAVRRLRELHHYAGDDDAGLPQAALLLGQAISDLVSHLPSTDPRLPELAREGLARLEDSGIATATVTKARQLLRRYVPASPGPRDANGPETLRLNGGDLTWNVDWETLREASEGARSAMAVLPLLMQRLPEEAQQGLAGMLQIVKAFDAGQWTPEHDRALANATQSLEASGLGWNLRAMSMIIRLQRCQAASGAAADWPSPAELDEVIAGLESAEDPASGLGGPLEAASGMPHFLAAQLLMARVTIDARGRGAARGRSWSKRTIKLLERARDHLNQYAIGVRGRDQADDRPGQHVH